MNRMEVYPSGHLRRFGYTMIRDALRLEPLPEPFHLHHPSSEGSTRHYHSLAMQTNGRKDYTKQISPFQYVHSFKWSHGLTWLFSMRGFIPSSPFSLYVSRQTQLNFALFSINRLRPSNIKTCFPSTFSILLKSLVQL